MSVTGNQIVYLADAGEVNTLTVSESAGILTFHDSTAPITASPEYSVVDANTVTIPAAGFYQINLTLLDMDDSLDASGVTASSGLGRTIIQGGSGDDTLIGSGLDDFFIEEAGNDTIDGLTSIRADQWNVGSDIDMVLTALGTIRPSILRQGSGLISKKSRWKHCGPGSRKILLPNWMTLIFS